MTPSGPTWRPNRSSVLLAALLLALVGSTHWIRLNVSPSVPFGLYRLAPVPLVLTRGMLVVLPVPALMRPWTAWPHIDLLKPVAGLPGDTVCVEAEQGLVVAGQGYGPVLELAHGKALPRLVGCFTVAYGEVFLASATPRSNDSRYFGPVQRATLRAQATPIWTWR